MEPTFSYYVSLFRESFVGYCRAELQKMGLTQGLLYFLLYVGKHPGCSQRELSSALGADEGYTARTVEKLEQRGLIQRSRQESDRRTFALTLTPEGGDSFDRAHALFEEWDEKVFRGITPGQKKALFEILEELRGRKEGQCHVLEDWKSDHHWQSDT